MFFSPTRLNVLAFFCLDASGPLTLFVFWRFYALCSRSGGRAEATDEAYFLSAFGWVATYVWQARRPDLIPNSVLATDRLWAETRLKRLFALQMGKATRVPCQFRQATPHLVDCVIRGGRGGRGWSKGGARGWPERIEFIFLFWSSHCDDMVFRI